MSDAEQQIGRVAFLTMLRAHFVYMSGRDEDELYVRASQVAAEGAQAVLHGTDAGGDVADLSLRTCLCGARIDGFDEYAIHLEGVFSNDA